MELPTKVKAELEKVDQITDGLGMPIDEGIRLTIAALMSLDFVTTSSCAGHSDNRTPYVTISSNELNDLYKSKSYKDLLDRFEADYRNRELNKKLREMKRGPQIATEREAYRLFNLIKDFYSNHKINLETVLVLQKQGLSFRLVNQGSIFANVMTEEDRTAWLEQAQEEIAQFTDFLIDKSSK